MNIVTIKWGVRYPSAYVNRLFEATRAHGLDDAEFCCYSDDFSGLDPRIRALPLPDIDLPEKYRWTFWRKLALFDPALGLTGPCLYFDLDVAITGDLRPLVVGWSGRPRFIRNWLGKKTVRRGNYERINSSVMLFEGSSGACVLERFHADQEAALTRYPTDQGFIHDCFAEQAEFFKEGQCVSFKRHCLPKFPLNLILPARVPDGACVVCFHGKPDPHEAAAGHSEGRLKHRCRPVRWINDIWR
jgi:hypothetical protein